jgi:predicted transcriptional regulator
VKGLRPGTNRLRLLLYLAEHRQPARHRELRDALEFRSLGSVAYQLGVLRRLGLVEKTAAGYKLAVGVAVSRKGYVGFMGNTFS